MNNENYIYVDQFSKWSEFDIKKHKKVGKKMGKYSNRWTRAAIPALLLHCSIGTVYCWSLLKGDIAEYIGYSCSSIFCYDDGRTFPVKKARRLGRAKTEIRI